MRPLTVVSRHVHGDDLDQAVALCQLPQEQLCHEEQEHQVLVVCRDAFRHGAATSRDPVSMGGRLQPLEK